MTPATGRIEKALLADGKCCFGGRIEKRTQVRPNCVEVEPFPAKAIFHNVMLWMEDSVYFPDITSTIRETGISHLQAVVPVRIAIFQKFYIKIM